MSSPESEWVTVALLGKTRGNRGELTAFSLSSKPERFENLREVYLFGSGQKYEVEETWFHLRTLIFKFRGVDTISDAEKLVGAGVYYGAALSEAAMYRGQHVYVLGGANSAGQGALFFSRYAERVTA